MSTQPPQDLPGAAEDLYGLDPAEFIAARDDRGRAARAAGNQELARQIGALRKPTTAAWAVNLLVRRRRADLQRLLSLADQLRSGAAAGDRAQVREHNRMAQRVVTAVTRLTGELAAEHGRPLTPALTDAVYQTLRAAMAHPEAARAVLSGCLVTTLRPGPMAGLGTDAATQPDVSDAVAVPVTVTSLAARGAGRTPAARSQRRERALAAARRAADEASLAADEAVHRAEDARSRADDLRERCDEAAAGVERARRDLAEREDRLAELRAALDDADRNRRRLLDRADEARRRAEDAAVTVEALSEPDEP